MNLVYLLSLPEVWLTVMLFPVIVLLIHSSSVSSRVKITLAAIILFMLMFDVARIVVLVPVNPPFLE